MNRRTMLQGLAAFAAIPLMPACSRASAPAAAATGATAASNAGDKVVALDKPTSFWRDKVDPKAFDVLFKEDTERAFSSPLNDEKRAGTFICAACYLPIFESDTKFMSGTGWPSFTQGIPGHTATKTDFKLILPRTEYHCARCGGHQGHIFDDGPAPRGERWCNNGLALKFVAKSEKFPALRG